MADQDVRALERRWQQSGALEDEVAWLQALLRCEALDPARLELAAYLGHPAALRALGPEACARRARARQARWDPEASPDPAEREALLWERSRREAAIGAEAAAREAADTQWTLALGEFGVEVSARVAFVAAEAVRSSWEPAGAPEEAVEWRARALRTFESLAAWLQDPCEERRAAVEAASAGHFSGGPGPHLRYGGPCAAAAEIVTDRGDDPEGGAILAAEATRKAAVILAAARGAHPEGDLEPELQRLQGALRAALIPWALGRAGAGGRGRREPGR